MKLGLAFMGDMDTSSVVRLSQKAEAQGFNSVWLAENYFFRDALIPSAAVASATKKVKIGQGVLNPWTRNPVLTAISLATLDELSNGRAVLGLGACVKYQIEHQMGIHYDKPVTALREFCSIFRDLLKERKVDHEGEVFQVRNVKLDFKPLRERIPVYFGSQYPKSLQTAGEIADGVLLTGGASLQHVEYAEENIKKGAETAGRSLKDVDLVSYILFSADENAAKARSATRGLLAFLLHFPEMGNLWLSQIGADTSIVPKITEAFRGGNVETATKYVTDDIVEALTVSGTPNHCRDRLLEYEGKGVQEMILSPVGTDLSEAFERSLKVASEF